MYKISLIIPPCTAEAELRKCLDSITAQAAQDVEILCVDDGSCGGCADTVAEYAARCGNIRLIRQEGKGLSDIAAAVSQEARGEYVFFLDGTPARKEAQLSLRLKATEKKLHALEEEKRRRPGQQIKAFFRTAKRRGLSYAVRDALWKLRRSFIRFMKNHTRGALQTYYSFAEEKGHRFARKEMAHIFRDKLQRLRRTPGVKRLMKEGGEQPLVSVILPVYNVAPYLEQAMDSLVNQTLKHIEIICVDDGSTDNSPEILARYAEKDPRVQIITQENQTLGAARNTGLLHANGEYVLFLDSDDFFELNLAEDAYFAVKRDDADAVIFNADIYDHKGGKMLEAPWLFRSQYMPKKSPFNYKDCPDTLFQATSPNVWNKLFRRQLLLDSGLQFQVLPNAEDISFTYFALTLAERIVSLDKILVHYRVGRSDSLEDSKAKAPLCFFDAYKLLLSRLKEKDLLQTLRRSYVNIALACCMYNWGDDMRGKRDPVAKQIVEEALRSYIFRDLELAGHEESYYYIDRHYKAMQAILSAEKTKE